MTRFACHPIVVALAGVLVASSVALGADALPATGQAFGDYRLVPLIGDGAAYAGPSTPASLADVSVSALVGRQLSAGDRARLAEQGFVVVPARLRLFHEAYQDQYGTGTPVFVTTDAVYNAWHQVFDKTLRDTEQSQLLPALEELVSGMRANAIHQRRELAGTVLAGDAGRVVDLLSVAAAELGTGSGTLSPRARAEKALIDAHTASTDSPILGTLTDYSLFTPRGHYTRNPDLTRFFVAMSVLGQHAFQLAGSQMADGSVVTGNGILRTAILAARTLVGHPELEALWQRIYEPTGFLVGVADDYTPFELADAVDAVADGGMAAPQAVAADKTLLDVADELKAMRPVQIDPERPSVRLMGTRFVIDSWILDQLVAPNVGTAAQPRLLGSSLDLAAAFGSDFALAIQDAAGETDYRHYPEQMDALRTAIAARPDEAWGQTVYDAWLAALEPMWLPHGAAFPDYMQGDAWRTKDQQTGFGSYAELKHDTILYTKQAGGDTTGGAPPRPTRNWVEPDPVPLQRLAAVATLTRDGLDERGLLSARLRTMLTEYVRMAQRLSRIATDELAGRPISAQDNDWLMYISGALESLWRAAGDQTGRWETTTADEDAAIIADVMRGVSVAEGDRVLETGTGFVDRIYVVVPDDAGGWQVASGGVYSTYEFPWPTAQRLTDERWREMLRDDKAPERPAWQDVLFAGPGSDGPAPTPQPSREALEGELGSSFPGMTWEPYRQSPAGSRFDPLKMGAQAAVIFDRLERDLQRSVDYAALFRFRSPARLDSYWSYRAFMTAVPVRNGACADGRAGWDRWLHGEVLCYVQRDGYAALRWTDQRTSTYGVLNAVAGRKDLADLYSAWALLVGGGAGG
jgi:hypothetical protein